MSGRRLSVWVGATVVWLFCYVLAYVWVVWNGDAKEWATGLRSFVPVAVAIPAAVLAGAFSRRNSYLQALRDLWCRLIPAVQGAIQYTHLREPKQCHFATVQKELSSAIDELRGVFKNTRAWRSGKGLYPYENLKDIKLVVDWIGYGAKFRHGDVEPARRCIVELWKEMHEAMLAEFDRSVPKEPVSKYLGGGASIADLLRQGRLRDSDFRSGVSPSRPRRTG